MFIVIADAWYLILCRVNLLATADYLKNIGLWKAPERFTNQAFVNLRAPQSGGINVAQWIPIHVCVCRRTSSEKSDGVRLHIAGLCMAVDECSTKQGCSRNEMRVSAPARVCSALHGFFPEICSSMADQESAQPRRLLDAKGAYK